MRAQPCPYGRSLRGLLDSELGAVVLERLRLPRPPRCGTCGTPVDEDLSFCSFACRQAAGISPPYGLEIAYAVALRSDPCSYCGAPAEHFEHIEPLRGGGDIGWTNITASCARCNARKPDALAALVSAARMSGEQPERVCGWCGTDITRRRSDALVCGPPCRREISRLRPLFEGKPLDGPYRSVLDRVIKHRRAKALLRADLEVSSSCSTRVPDA